jgi:hypothetical protein
MMPDRITDADLADDDWVPRANLGRYWPMLSERTARGLAERHSGPPYITGVDKRAWYRVGDVRAWLREELNRQSRDRAKLATEQPSKPSPPRLAGKVMRAPRRGRQTKMARYLAGQRHA